MAARSGVLPPRQVALEAPQPAITQLPAPGFDSSSERCCCAAAACHLLTSKLLNSRLSMSLSSLKSALSTCDMGEPSWVSHCCL